MATFILSYPRSGNHLIRFIVEFITLRATQGCLPNIRDIPICRNTFPGEHPLKDVDAAETVAYKAHFVEEINAGTSSKFIVCDKVILCIRNPLMALSSHCLKTIPGLRSKNPNLDLAAHLNAEYAKWENNILSGMRLPSSSIEVIRYERLVSSDLLVRHVEIAKIAGFFRDEVHFDRYAILLTNSEEYSQMSKLGKDRDWGGVGTTGPGDSSNVNEFENTYPNLRFTELVVGLLTQTLDKFSTLGKKFPIIQRHNLAELIEGYRLAKDSKTEAKALG